MALAPYLSSYVVVLVFTMDFMGFSACGIHLVIGVGRWGMICYLLSVRVGDCWRFVWVE